MARGPGTPLVRAGPPADAGAGAVPTPATPPVGTGIAAPDPALVEPGADFPGRMLPRIGANGDRPFVAHAARPGVPAYGPQVTIPLGALGVAGPLRPVTIERLRAWSRDLSSRGVTLVPVSALPPPHPNSIPRPSIP